MIWISIIGLVLQLVTKLPEIVALLERIFGRLAKGGLLTPVRVMREGARVQEALAEKLGQLAFAEKHGLAASAVVELACPLEALADELDQRYADKVG